MKFIQAYSSLTKKNIVLKKCKNLNQATDELFESLSLSLQLIMFVRIGHTIEFKYKIGNSLDINSGYILLTTAKGGYKEVDIIYVKLNHK